MIKAVIKIKNAKEHDNNLLWNPHDNVFYARAIEDFFIYFN